MITFETMRKIQKAEEKGGLSKLPDNFFGEAKAYLDNLKPEELEHKNASSILQQIYDARKWKVLKLAVSGEVPDEEIVNMLPEESKMLEEIRSATEKCRTSLLEKAKKGKGINVRFLEDFPAFMGSDMKEYGPYKKGEDASIPGENAEILAKRGKVERV